ncbi:dimethyl sulfoxide reductase anchor subunit [Escherichia coli]|nr:dimethyl sulfoxide reductase anchor subunit [Escherichia coli]
MGNGWHEWPLVIFTVLGQCVVGALIVSGIGWFAAKMTQTVSTLFVACFSSGC